MTPRTLLYNFASFGAATITAIAVMVVACSPASRTAPNDAAVTDDTAVAAEATAPVRTLHESHCAVDTFDGRKRLECGTLEVPENRSNPDSRLIEIRYVRMRTRANNPLPPVVILAGGPGSPGFTYLRASLFRPILQVADIIAVDQRGTGNNEMTCRERLSFPNDRPGSEDDLRPLIEEWSQRCLDQHAAQGYDLAAYNTNENADDLDDLRHALAIDKWTLWGGSYGAHLALTYLRRHGEHVERMILTSVEGPDHTFKLPSTYERYLEKLSDVVAKSPTTMAEVPDLVALVKELVATFGEEPIAVTTDDGDFVIGAMEVQWLVTSSLGRYYRMKRLPKLLYELDTGYYDNVVPAMRDTKTAWELTAMSMLMDAASSASPQRTARVREEAASSYLGNPNWPYPEIAVQWQPVPLGPEFWAPVESDVPVLMISGSLDARTPPENADEVARTLSNSHHVVIENGAHGAGDHPEVMKMMMDFLEGKPLTQTRVFGQPIAFDPIQ